MLARKDVEEALRRCKPVLQQRFNVSRIGLFGSYVRGEQTDKSDVDVLVEFSRPIGWEFVDLKDYLEAVLHTKVDVVTAGALKPSMSEAILREVVYQ